MSTVSTHVLDTALGRPAAGVPVRLETAGGELLASEATDGDGRVGALGPDDLSTGIYRLRFDTADYFAKSGFAVFFPEVAVAFEVGGREHYHVPLLLSPYSYSTYRGS
jgi:5-hydroxyisourate hydrolase